MCLLCHNKINNKAGLSVNQSRQAQATGRGEEEEEEGSEGKKKDKLVWLSK